MSEEQVYSARHWAAKAAASAQDAAQSAQNSRGLAIGQLVWSQSSLAKDNPGCLPAWTGEYYPNAAALYPDFYAWVKSHPELCKTKAQYDEALSAYGECPYYVADEVAGSLRLPKLVNYIKSADETNGITQRKAGLPTVKAISNTAAGNIPDFTSLPPYAKPVQNTNSYALMTGGSITRATSLVYVENDASLNSSVYGASETVTPAHTTLYPWVCAYNAAVPASTVQAAEFIQTVSEMQTSKLDKAASNNFIGFVDTTAGISITLPYTATSNGWICCTWNGDNAYSSGALAIDGVNVFYHLSSARDGRDSYWGNTALIPIRTGQVVTSTGTVPPNGNKLFFPFKNY